MRISEARSIAINPERHQDHIRLARLVLGNAALRAFPSSPKQRAIRELINNIESTMPRKLWQYPLPTLPPTSE